MAIWRCMTVMETAKKNLAGGGATLRIPNAGLGLSLTGAADYLPAPDITCNRDAHHFCLIAEWEAIEGPGYPSDEQTMRMCIPLCARLLQSYTRVLITDMYAVTRMEAWRRSNTQELRQTVSISRTTLMLVLSLPLRNIVSTSTAP